MEISHVERNLSKTYINKKQNLINSFNCINKSTCITYCHIITLSVSPMDNEHFYMVIIITIKTTKILTKSEMQTITIVDNFTPQDPNWTRSSHILKFQFI